MKDGLKHLQVKKQWKEAMNFRRENTAFIEESYQWERGTDKNSSKLTEPLFHYKGYSETIKELAGSGTERDDLLKC